MVAVSWNVALMLRNDSCSHYCQSQSNTSFREVVVSRLGAATTGVKAYLDQQQGSRAEQTPSIRQTVSGIIRWLPPTLALAALAVPDVDLYAGRGFVSGLSRLFSHQGYRHVVCIRQTAASIWDAV